MVQKKLFIQTIGCAMNELDSAHIIAELRNKEGFEPTNDPKEADLIIINTCSVREKPVLKLFSEIGNYSKIRKKGAKIGVCGCTASHLGEEIIKRAPVVSFVLGARNVSKISEIIHKEGAVEIDINYDESTYPFSTFRENPYKALINISIGCDKSCTYCIVPFTRGQEISIPPEIILNEVKRVADSGIKEIILLGQNVNNYGRRFSDLNIEINFTKLLKEISKIDGIERIRFTSPHPLHADDEFLEEFAANPKICKSIHFPLQSGSDKILKRMKRGYTKKWYLNRARKIRELAPSATIGTDIIVGFPGESNEDFLETLEVIKEVAFEQIFSFKYSPRPFTEALNFTDTVDSKIAQERLEILQEMHKVMLDEINKKEVGKIHEVLFEEIDADGLLEGRSNNNKIVKARGSDEFLGKICNVKITKSGRLSLFGEIL